MPGRAGSLPRAVYCTLKREPSTPLRTGSLPRAVIENFARQMRTLLRAKAESERSRQAVYHRHIYETEQVWESFIVYSSTHQHK